MGDTTYDNVLRTHVCPKPCADAVLAVSPYRTSGPTDDAAESTLVHRRHHQPARRAIQLSGAHRHRPVARARGQARFAAHPNICGIKDTVDTISHTRKVIRAVRKVNPEFSVLSGFDEYYLVNRERAAATGALCGLTNVEPPSSL